MQESGTEIDPIPWIESVIRDFVRRSPENSLRNSQGDPAWSEPLVGLSNGADPVFQAFKEQIGPFHWTPLEAFTQNFSQHSLSPDELTVISWILPQTEATKDEHRKETAYPGERWARSRVFGEQFNERLRRHLVATLKEAGYPAVAPSLSPLFQTQMSERFGYASNWSERHVAYASGLGTFGLSDGLITSRGQAMRCGSVVTRIFIPPTPRPYSDHRAYCLFFSQGRCGACIPRCPVGAITEAGHDKVACRKYLYQTIASHVKSHYGFEGYACGLCQTNVPCESRIPF